MLNYRIIAFAGVSLMALATPAHAQEAALDADQTRASDIVVTGTLIRGAAPGGANVVSVTEKAVQATGASTTAQLLQSIPQLGSFGNLQFPASGGTITANRPNLRSLPGFNSGGGSTTLVLLNGHRIVGMGVASTTPDPDFIPPGAIQRLEIVPDGGSAIYGSDAVAGVLNFITRRDFDGVEANARYGFADDYNTFDANGTIGKKWDGGSIFVSYAYSQHDAIFGRDRDFVRMFPSTRSFTATGPATSLPITCAPGNVVVNNTSIYGLPFTTATAAAAAGKPSQCDTTDDASYYPKEHHHSVMAGLNQQLSDSLSVDLSAYYFNRKMESNNGRYLASGKSATPTTLGFAEHRVGAETSQSVSFAFGNPDATRATIATESWGVTGEFTYKLGGDWRVRLMGNYGESTTTNHIASFNDNTDSVTGKALGLQAAIANGLFNPYDPAASNPAAVAAITNWESFGRGRQRLANVRAVADGTLLELPGGAVKLAVGAEYISEGLVTTSGIGIPGSINSGFSAVVVNGVTLIPTTAGRPTFNLSRNVKAAFGELSIPLFGADNAAPLFRELALSLSGRYDSYSDVGDTFNPRIGLTWRPVDGIRLRGSWSKAFNAPSLADSDKAALTTAAYFGPLSFFNGTVFTPPANLVASGQYPTPGAFQTVLLISGNSPGIKPQTANTLSLGADIEPSFLPNLRFGATYWRIRMSNGIRVPFIDRNAFWGFYGGSLITTSPSETAVAQAVAKADVPPTGTKCFPGQAPNCVYAILDGRKYNAGDTHVSGLDFYVNYRRDTRFGGVDLTLNGTYELTREENAAKGAPFQDKLLGDTNRFRFSATTGADIGNLRAQITWNYLQGFDLGTPAAVTGQTHIGDYNVFNLFFKYNVPSESGMLKDLAFTLNVDNVFDQDPPLDTSPNKSLIYANGYANGQTLGRLIQFGVSKRF